MGGLSEDLEMSSGAIASIASRLVGELHSAYLANDWTKQTHALNALLALPSGPMDASLSQLVLPALLRVPAATTSLTSSPFNDENSSNAAASASNCRDADGQGLVDADPVRGNEGAGDWTDGSRGGSSSSNSGNAMMQSVYARAIARWGSGTGKNGGNNDNNNNNKGSHIRGSAPDFGNVPFNPATAGPRQHNDNGDWAAHNAAAADSNHTSSGFHRREFDASNIAPSTLGDFSVLDRPLEPSSSDDDAAAMATFERYLAEGDSPLFSSLTSLRTLRSLLSTHFIYSLMKCTTL